MSILAEFSDVSPVPQDDGANPVCAIKYRDEFRGAMDVFRAILRSGEKSERVVRLTECLLNMNAANYTVWQYRRDCLTALALDPSQEFDFMDRFAESNPKNYQIWYHRRAITERSGDASRELAFVNRVFEEDAKNYHAWAHRQWVVKTFGQWEGELNTIEALLTADVRNNSAWNHRWFVLRERAAPLGSVDGDVQAEVDYVWARVLLAPDNESPWNFLRGLCREYHHVRAVVRAKCLAEFGPGQGQDQQSAHVNVFACDLYAHLCEQAAAAASAGSEGLERGAGAADERRRLLLEAVASFDTLAAEDAIRTKYWRKRGATATAALNAAQE